MAKKTTPEIKSKSFHSVTEVDSGIRKLQRRLDDVKALHGLRHDDQKVDTAVANMVDTIREVFGDNSPELQRHQYHRIWKGSMTIGESKASIQAKFEAGIPDTIEVITGLIEKLREKRLDLEDTGASVGLDLLNSLSLHPEIAKATEQLLRDGHYSQAVFEASKVLVSLVKKKAPQLNKDGTGLMFAAFQGTPPPIRFNALSNQAELDEQSGMGHLFAGAVLALRNPRGHELWTDTRERALEYIGFLSLLAKRLEEAQM